MSRRDEREKEISTNGTNADGHLPFSESAARFDVYSKERRANAIGVCDDLRGVLSPARSVAAGII